MLDPISLVVRRRNPNSLPERDISLTQGDSDTALVFTVYERDGDATPSDVRRAFLQFAVLRDYAHGMDNWGWDACSGPTSQFYNQPLLPVFVTQGVVGDGANGQFVVTVPAAVLATWSGSYAFQVSYGLPAVLPSQIGIVAPAPAGPVLRTGASTILRGRLYVEYAPAALPLPTPIDLFGNLGLPASTPTPSTNGLLDDGFLLDTTSVT